MHSFSSFAQRTLFGGQNNYVAPVAPVPLVPTGTNPVTNGLILYLDATRSASYGGTGTTWNDISGQSPANTATLVGSPTFGSGNLSEGYGSLTFSGTNYATTSKSNI